MTTWTREQLSSALHDFDAFNNDSRQKIAATLDILAPYSTYCTHRDHRRTALSQMNRIRDLLAHSKQSFPTFIPSSDVDVSAEALKGFAIVLTAGGEGERLRVSLGKKGYTDAALTDFSKATFALPGFPDSFGALHINLVMIASMCEKSDIDIPVVITTGPAGSVTARIIPDICARHNNFGLKNLRVIAQDERLFLTNDEKIVLRKTGDGFEPITHPDETGGPIMKLKDATNGQSVLAWLSSIGCTKTVIVQGTALYHTSLLPLMGAALGDHDCCGVGILRSSFPPKDPYGTFVTLENSDQNATVIIEQDIRNDETRTINDDSGKWHLPFNTGFYAFKNTLLETNDLPDFATPPKELRPDLPRSPKIGYAATDLITLARNPAVLTIDQSMFAVLKNADDIDVLATLGKEFGLVTQCESFLSS